jgi:hypothetical protein
MQFFGMNSIEIVHSTEKNNPKNEEFRLKIIAQTYHLLSLRASFFIWKVPQQNSYCSSEKINLYFQTGFAAIGNPSFSHGTAIQIRSIPI